MVAATEETLTTAPPSRAAGAHGAEGVLYAERGAEHVDVQHPPHVGRVQVDDQPGDLHAGVVDDNVQPAELVDHDGDGLLPAGVVDHVERHEPGGGPRAAQRVGGGLAEIL